MARLKVGTTPACADARFVVEGIWITLDIRFALGALAERVYSRLSSQPKRNQAQIDAWGHFTTFIYDTCSRDAGIAFNIASSTQAHRQKLLTSLGIVRSVWRNTRFLVTSKQSREEALGVEERINLMREVEERLGLQKKNVGFIREAYVRQGVLTHDTIERDFGAPAQEYLNHWEILVSALRQPGGFYQAVSEKEAQGAVESFTECTHRSHWQICPNGHIFTIGACGSAVSNGRCYECKATTSDVSHQMAGIMRKEIALENIMTEWRIID
ncbi:hypothetical protein FRC16_003069 [Serendipita sp. 398]|nr:hypothetical protein FRC16_003069 [Serendipita sp. 398]